MNRNKSAIAGYGLSALTLLLVLADAGTILLNPAKLQAEMNLTGFPMTLAPALGTIELIAAILYAIPRTAVLGAILIAAFFGGAICAHFRLGELGSLSQCIATSIGILAWAGLWFRDARVRALLPFTQTNGGTVAAATRIVDARL